MNRTIKDALMMTRTWPLLLAGGLLLPAWGCTSVDAILDIDDPDIVNPADLRSLAGAAAAFVGGVGDFSLAVVGDNGGTEGQILVGGLMSDEYIHSGTFPTRLEYERRSINQNANVTLTGVNRNLHRARVSLEQSVALLQQYAPTPASRIGEAFGLAGYTYIWFGETYCSGVPFSSASTLGTPKTTTEIFQIAIERFDSALTYLSATDTASANVRARNLVLVGKARALMNIGRSEFANAAAVVGGVPLTFVYNTTHSTTTGRQQNGVHVFNHLSERWSVADNEGGNGLDFRSANDPRVQVTSGGLGFDASTPQWNLTKYPARTTPLPIANGIEAKLITAEQLLNAGNPSGWLDTLNFLRASGGVAGLAALADPVDSTARQNLMFRERAFWLFATGHRLGDLRRLMRQYGRAEDAVFPTGTHFKGDAYGNDVNIPVPPEELGNPNFTGCSTTTP
jgi:hypothetical protein